MELYRNNGHNINGPKALTIAGLEALSEKHRVIQDGPVTTYDEYGRPTNIRLVRAEDYIQTAKLQLNAIYHNLDLTTKERQEAGEALKYTSFRIAFHEYFVPAKRKARAISHSISCALGKLLIPTRF